MSIFRSYFSKNNTIISNNNFTNNSQNPVTEISYGTPTAQVSRFIFDIDLSKLADKITKGLINKDNIVRHTLVLTNSIGYSQNYIGKKSYDGSTDRTGSFTLDIVKINEDWDEGSGYEFTYNSNQSDQASNWINKKTGQNWTVAGIFSLAYPIIKSQTFDVGNENISIDITDYINERLVSNTSSFGLGIKFPDNIESLKTINRQAVAFHTKYTNTFYQPFIETEIKDEIIDDRNYFFLDKNNSLYLYRNSNLQNIIVNNVKIIDENDNIIKTIIGSSIKNPYNNNFNIVLNLDSSIYPDAVIFNDVWDISINGKQSTATNDFYLIAADKYYEEDHSNPSNYHFTYWGINDNEHIKAGDIRRIRISVKQLYCNQDSNLPIDIEYRLFTTIAGKYEIEQIPFTKVNRLECGHEFNLDTSWLIPQDYKLQLRMKNGNYYTNKEILKFSIISENIF